jgi:hypothetical protein
MIILQELPAIECPPHVILRRIEILKEKSGSRFADESHGLLVMRSVVGDFLIGEFHEVCHNEICRVVFSHLQELSDTSFYK